MKNAGSASHADMHNHDVEMCKKIKSPTTSDKWGMRTRYGGTFYFKTKEAALLRLQYLDEHYEFLGLVEPMFQTKVDNMKCRQLEPENFQKPTKL